jgi:hypothetical protein
MSPNIPPDNRAISSVNVLGNFIEVEQAQELIKILQTKEKLTTLCGFSGNETELNLSKKNLSAGCLVLVANEISDMGALLVLSLKSNNLRAAGGKALAEGLKGNQVIAELNIAGNYLGLDGSSGTDLSGAIALAEVIPDMGALSTLTFSGERYWNGRNHSEDAVSITTALTDADFSGKHLGSPGAIILAAWISSDKGALIKLDISNNRIGAAQKQDLQRICMASGIKLAK